MKLKIKALITVFLFFLSCTDDRDREPPTGYIVSPLTGSTVSATVEVVVMAEDNKGVESVEFTVNGQTVYSDYGGPWIFPWNTLDHSDGKVYTLSSIITDVSDNIANSDSVSVIVQNRAPHDRIHGTIHGIISDASDNSRLDSVQIYWADGNQLNSITNSDSLGYYIISDLNPGDYTITFVRDGYSIQTETHSVPILNEVGGTWTTTQVVGEDFYISKYQNVDLYGLSAGLKGRYFKKIDNENTMPADSLTVIAHYSNYQFSPNEYYATTNDSGKFEFDNLPSTTEVELKTLPHNDGVYEFSSSNRMVGLYPGIMSFVDDYALSRQEKTATLLANNFMEGKFKIDEDLFLRFSKPMQADVFIIRLRNDTSGSDVEADIRWRNNNTDLTIAPFTSLKTDATYTLSLEGKSADNNSFSAYYSFTTQGGIKFLASNLQRENGLYDGFPVDSTIILRFSEKVDLERTISTGYINLKDDSDAIQAVKIDYEEGDSTVVQVDPQYSLQPGANYTLSFSIYSVLRGDDQTSGSISFSTYTEILRPELITQFELDMDINWFPDWDTKDIKFKWGTVENADGYRLYARDNKKNPNPVRLLTKAATDYGSELTAEIDLAGFPRFDSYSSDGIQTPFGDSTAISFGIVAYNPAGESDYSEEITVVDITQPSLSEFSQSGSADNSHNAEVSTFSISVRASELLDTTMTFWLTEKGGDGSYLVPDSVVDFDWDSDFQGGDFTLTMPGLAKAWGDEFWITYLRDGSTNVNSDSSFLLLEDRTGPVIMQYVPANGAIDVDASADIVLTLNEEIKILSGNFVIKKKDDDSTVESISVSSDNVSGDGTSAISINPSSDLIGNTSFYLLIDSATFEDVNGNDFSGVSDKTTWAFTTLEDVTAPILVSVSPSDNATSVAVETDLTMTFSDNIEAGSGKFRIKKSSDDSAVHTINASSEYVTGTGTKTITVNPSSNLTAGTGYYVTIDTSAFDDVSGNGYAGISSKSAWNFTTRTDITAPTVSSFSPANGATGVALDANLEITFSEVVIISSGKITIMKSSWAGDSVYTEIDVTGTNVSGSETTTITIDPDVNLEASTEYYILVDSGAFTDSDGNNFGGITSSTDWTFTTTE